jgi:PAS domain S-box-containing protein
MEHGHAIEDGKRAQDELLRRDAILEALASAAALSLHGDSLDNSTQEILAALGTATNVSRVYIFKNHTGDSGVHLTSQCYEWTARHISPQINNPDTQSFPWQSGGMGRWEETLSRGEIIEGHVRDFPPGEQEILAPQEIKSIVAVPIFLGACWWGFMGFDECRSEREWSKAEIEALKTSASTIGAFIHRAEVEKALSESEQKFRALFDHIPTMAFVVDRDHRLVACNQKFGEKMGDQVDQKTGELMGVPQNAIEPSYEVEEQVFRSGEPAWYVQISKAGQQYSLYLETRLQPIKDAGGKVWLLVGMVTDVTSQVTRQIALADEVKALRVQIGKHSAPAIVGKSRAITEVLSRVQAIAAADTTVLITGETGTGKELVAEAVHGLSKRAKRPLVKVNCAALPESIIESELFGHVKGAFTGAFHSRMGRFEAAHRGTIFLDEIGDISPNVQVRLLRVLEERKVERVGDHKPIMVDVRIVAGTNRPLEKLVQGGGFREDLFYRLNVFSINVPALRDRKDDIPLLVAHFLNNFSRTMGKKIGSVSREVMERLLQHNWRGNVRELMNVVESACVLCRGGTIELEHLPPLSESWPFDVEARGKSEIAEALRRTGGNKTRAARLLGVDRTTLYRKLRRYGIAV